MTDFLISSLVLVARPRHANANANANAETSTEMQIATQIQSGAMQIRARKHPRAYLLLRVPSHSCVELGRRQEGSDLASCITHKKGYHDICSKDKSLLAY